MEENKNTCPLTDEDVKQITETLKKAREKSTPMTSILDKVVNEEYPKEEMETVEILVDPDGEESISGFAKSIMDNYDITLDDINNADISDFDNMKITRQMIRQSDFAKEENISDEEIIELLNFIERYSSGEKFNYYNEAPKFLQSWVREVYGEGGGQLTKQEICKITIDQLISDIKMDQAVLDFNEAIKNELKIPTLSDLYSEFVKENFEEKLLEVADQCEEEDPDKAKLLREVSNTYKKTYTFEVLQEALNNRKVRQFIKDPTKYKKMCRKFNDKYINSRFNIYSIEMCYNAIKEAIPEMEDEYIKKFIMLICKTCENMDPDNINDHVFMYYTIQNIRLLQHDETLTEDNTRSEMYSIVIKNINDTVDKIKEYEAKSPRK